MTANFLTRNPIHHAQTKHVAIHYHFVREQVVAGQLEAKFVCSKEQLADALTKPLPQTEFKYLCSKLMEEPPICLRGDVEGSGIS